MPIGLEADFEGVVDLVTMEALYFDGNHGEQVRRGPIPDALLAEAVAQRETLVDAASMFSDTLTEAILEETEVTADMIRQAVRQGVLQRRITPVFVGSAYKNKGVQPLLDAVTALLPCPADVSNEALDLDREEAAVILESRDDALTVALAFKLEDGPYGQLTYIRTYQGQISKGDTLINVRSGKKVKIGRLVRMHANEMEEIDRIPAGFIGALFGIDCASGDTFASPGLRLTMTSMFVPEPVISLAIVPKDNKAQINMSKALNRLHQGGPDLSHLRQRRNRRHHHRGHGRAAPGSLRRAHAPRIRCDGDHRPAPGGLPRDHHPGGRIQLYPQEADRWRGPVRPHRRTDGADHRGGLRLCQQGDRRLHSHVVHSRLREGFSQLHGQGAADGASGQRGPGDHRRRRGPFGGFVGHGLPGCRPGRFSRGLRKAKR